MHLWPPLTSNSRDGRLITCRTTPPVSRPPRKRLGLATPSIEIVSDSPVASFPEQESRY